MQTGTYTSSTSPHSGYTNYIGTKTVPSPGLYKFRLRTHTLPNTVAITLAGTPEDSSSTATTTTNSSSSNHLRYSRTKC